MLRSRGDLINPILGYQNTLDKIKHSIVLINNIAIEFSNLSNASHKILCQNILKKSERVAKHTLNLFRNSPESVKFCFCC